MKTDNLNKKIKRYQVLLNSFYIVFFFGFIQLTAQNNYSYNLDLTKVVNDMVKVELTPPKIKQSEIIFHLPKIIPGTYRIADYGRFIKDFQAFDKKGNILKSEKIDPNSWKIYGSKKLRKITYWVEDSFDTELEGASVFEPAGTNIEKGKNFVLNASGVFGYFKGKKDVKFELNITRDTNMYGATGLSSNNTNVNLNPSKGSEKIPLIEDTKIDKFATENYNDLVDSPIMYTTPADTTTIKIANTEVLIASYSPNKIISSKEIASTIKEILFAQKEYLGGELPVDKYAFIFYFDEEPRGSTGALEHSYSSMYFLKERPIDQMKQWLRNVAAHEFFHIVTPLNIHSEEIHDFDYIEPKMSQHLWLYEGVTEYFASNMQVKGGIINRTQYLDVLRNKIRNASSRFKNDLSFTDFSKNVIENLSEFGNVYQKGALIGMCLDIKLRTLSQGSYGMQNLVSDLAKQFGKNRPFKDDELFNHITKLTYPEIGEFLNSYVGQNNPLPLQDIFSQVGINYTHEKSTHKYSVGLTNSAVDYKSSRSKFYVANANTLDEFGKSLKLKTGDLLLEINGNPIPGPSQVEQFINSIKSKLKEGDQYTIKVIRKEGNDIEREVLLENKVFKIEDKTYDHLNVDENASKEQIQIREAWLSASN